MISPYFFFGKREYFLFFAITICLLFTTLYSILSIVRHNHYESYGYDLGINDQTVWRYSRFEAPIMSIAPFPGRSKLEMHVELIYAIISPFYWIWPTRRMLLLVSTVVLCSGGMAIYLLSKRRLRGELISFAMLISYLSFYGLQFAAWTDVHSANFAAAFMAWFLYGLDTRKKVLSILFFVLAITSKENIAIYTLIIALLYLLRRREKIILFFAGFSVFYLLFVFFIFFPHVMHVSYFYQNREGLLSNFNPLYLFNTKEKLVTLFYSFLSVGFLPIFNPLTLPLVMTHFITFFVVASDLPGAQGLFGHYRVTLDPLLSWSTIITIATFKFLNRKFIAIYILLCTILVQYLLHPPLSYLSKPWFWETKSSVVTINNTISYFLPPNASVASQNNITPHISHRDKIYTLYPTTKEFTNNSPCGKIICDWLTWYAHPDYIIVDISKDWDTRHLLTSREHYLAALANIEKKGFLQRYKVDGSTILYKVKKIN